MPFLSLFGSDFEGNTLTFGKKYYSGELDWFLICHMRHQLSNFISGWEGFRRIKKPRKITLLYFWEQF